MLEPSYAVGGDAFDYALSHSTAVMAIFDALGHTLNAGLIVAAVLAAYRSARRDGRGLHDQARAMDDTIIGQFGRGLLATGILAELDASTGRLRYVAAGHPPPLVLRSGKVVKTLTGGRRPPFGVATPELTVAEETLQPGDWLVLYTTASPKLATMLASDLARSGWWTFSNAKPPTRIPHQRRSAASSKPS